MVVSQTISWLPGEIVMDDSTILNTHIMISEPFLQGTVVIKNDSEPVSLSTLSILSLRIFDKINKDTLVFENTVEQLLNEGGTEVLYSGPQYTLYSKFTAHKHFVALGAPTPGALIIGYSTYMRREEVLLFKRFSGPTHQIN